MGLPWLNMLLLLLSKKQQKTGKKRKKSQYRTYNRVPKIMWPVHCIFSFLFFVGCMTLLTFILVCLKINPTFSQFVTKSCFKLPVYFFVTVQAFCTQQICTTCMHTTFCTLFVVCGLHFVLTIKISQELYKIKVQLNTV